MSGHVRMFIDDLFLIARWHSDANGFCEFWVHCSLEHNGMNAGWHSMAVNGRHAQGTTIDKAFCRWKRMNAEKTGFCDNPVDFTRIRFIYGASGVVSGRWGLS